MDELFIFIFISAGHNPPPLNQLSLERYLGELDNPQIAFNVRQKQPKTLDEAVMCTLETEIYLRDSKGAKSAVSAVEVPVAVTGLYALSKSRVS